MPGADKNGIPAVDHVTMMQKRTQMAAEATGATVYANSTRKVTQLEWPNGPHIR